MFKWSNILPKVKDYKVQKWKTNICIRPLFFSQPISPLGLSGDPFGWTESNDVIKISVRRTNHYFYYHTYVTRFLTVMRYFHIVFTQVNDLHSLPVLLFKSVLWNFWISKCLLAVLTWTWTKTLKATICV